MAEKDTELVSALPTDVSNASVSGVFGSFTVGSGARPPAASAALGLPEAAVVSAARGSADSSESFEEEEIEEEEIFDVAIAWGIHIVYLRCKGETFIQIRDYEGAVVNFTPIRLKMLWNRTAEIAKQLRRKKPIKVYKDCELKDRAYKLHLGGGLYALIDEKCSGLQIRRYFTAGWPSVIPSEEGIYIPRSQWKTFERNLGALYHTHRYLLEVEECTHEFSRDEANCKECHPFGLLVL
jgi:hypothetical protein